MTTYKKGLALNGNIDHTQNMFHIDWFLWSATGPDNESCSIHSFLICTESSHSQTEELAPDTASPYLQTRNSKSAGKRTRESEGKDGKPSITAWVPDCWNQSICCVTHYQRLLSRVLASLECWKNLYNCISPSWAVTITVKIIVLLIGHVMFGDTSTLCDFFKILFDFQHRSYFCHLFPK